MGVEVGCYGALMKTSFAVRALRARPVAALATLMAVAALGNAVIVGCGGSNSSSTTTTSNQPPPTPTPSPNTGGTAAGGDLGAQVYANRCVLCHGPLGKGDGSASAALNPKPRNHTDGSYMNAQTDEQLLEVIRKGKGAMPAWEKVLSDEEIRAVLKHVRTLAQPPYPGAS